MAKCQIGDREDRVVECDTIQVKLNQCNEPCAQGIDSEGINEVISRRLWRQIY